MGFMIIRIMIEHFGKWRTHNQSRTVTYPKVRNRRTQLKTVAPYPSLLCVTATFLRFGVFFIYFHIQIVLKEATCLSLDSKAHARAKILALHSNTSIEYSIFCSLLRYISPPTNALYLSSLFITCILLIKLFFQHIESVSIFSFLCKYFYLNLNLKKLSQ